MKLPVALCCLAGGLFLASCHKDKSVKPGTASGSSATASSDEDSLKYLMYNIMQVSFEDGGRDLSNDLPTYYWYSQVPVLDPLSSQYSDAEDLLSVMAGYPENASTGNAIDRYSFLDRTGSVASEIQDGVVEGNLSGTTGNGDFGLEVTYALDNSYNSHLIVLYADKNSPAGQLGIQRGWEITAVNGDTAVSYDGENGSNVSRITNALYGTNADAVTLTFEKPDNTSQSYTINAAQYNINPILFDSVYVKNNHKIGYFAFYTFSSVYNEQGVSTYTKQVLDEEFSKLKAAGINDLVVDLRYNGGGAVTTAEYLDSAIAPASAAGKTMYQYLYNGKLTENESALGLTSKVLFSSTGGLSLDHVFFIVSRSTASASELTMNNLKPYMDVKLVGDTTYGKPVGFIDFTISDYDSAHNENYLADLYAIDFETKNANGVGEYYDGIVPDEEAYDYINVPWGDPNDDNLNKIFSYISSGSYTRANANGRTRPTSVYRAMRTERAVMSHRFNGMIDYRLSRQIKSGANRP